MNKVEKLNLNVLAFKEINNVFKKEYWFAVQCLIDKNFEGLTEKEEEFIKSHNELITLIAKNIKLEAKIDGSLSLEEISEWYDHFLLIYILSKENTDKIRNKVDIGCPICRSKLVYVKSMRAETLNEHVSCREDGYISKKDMYGCPNENCEVHKRELLWIGDGEGYYGSYKFDNKNLPFIDNNPAPFRTFYREIEAEKEKSVGTIKIFDKIMFELFISSKADENGKKHWNKIFHLRTYIKEKNGLGWIYYSSGIHMFIFSIKCYAKKHSRVQEFKNKISWEDKRWWAKLSFSLAKIIWKKDYLKAIEK